MKRERLCAEWKLRAVGEEEWMKTSVPGSVLETLLKYDKVKNPYEGLNEYEVREEFRKDYQYFCTFEVKETYLKEEQLDLIFYCLDTVTEISINGTCLGKTDNMHRAWRFSVKDFVHAGENTMEILFQSPITYVEHYVPREGREITMSNIGTMYGSQYIRKAHSMFGWDWGAQLPDSGILRPVELEAYSGARLLEAEILQRHENGRVELTVYTQMEKLIPSDDFYTVVSLHSPDGAKIQKTTGEDGKAVFQIENPRLWWPNGYGSQPLYQVKVSLKKQEQELDTKWYQIGLRTIKVSQEKDIWGSEFAFKVNGIKIFAKGANYIPEDCVYPWITTERLERLTNDAVFANFNCLRVWGGGYYPSDEFYDLCDRKGILVWQDLMFACNIYDLTPEFIQNIEEEARYNVTRLRHHAALAMWCGNNEMETAWVNWKEVKNHPLSLKRDYLIQFEYILSNVVKECDKERFYMPSSPCSGGSFDNPEDENRGDSHYWEVWHGQKPFSEYLNHYFRFCSEFGFQSFPSIKTIRTFAKEEEMNIFSEVMESHQKNPAANGKILYYLSENFRYPKNLDSLVYLSQLMQGIAMKTAIDHWRRNRGRCMGSLYWQFNDNWPVASWSSVDYFGRYKALHYMAARFYAPLAGSIRKENSLIEAWAENETLHDCFCQVSMTLKKMDFTVLDQYTAELEVPALSTVKMAVKEYAALIKNIEKDVFLECRFVFTKADGSMFTATETEVFAPYKYLKLQEPDIEVRLNETEQFYQLEVSSDTFTPYLSIDFKNCDAVLSDNCFSITDRQPIRLSILPDTVQKPENFKRSLKEDIILKTIRTTYD